MKKLLLVLLIAFAATATVKVETEELQSWWDDIWGGITNFLSKLSKKAKEIYQWLVDNGYWQQIIDYVKKYGVPAAIEFCAKKTGARDICATVINILAGLLK